MTGPGTSTAIKSGPSRGLKRLRLRWVVVALALWATAFFTWRFSHRGDPRFVGRWRVQGHGYGDAEMELELTRFGTGTRRLTPAEQDAPIVEFAWRVEEERLIFSWPPPEGPLRERIQLYVMNAWRRWHGEPEGGTDAYTFESIDGNGYRFRSETSQDSMFELSRIKE